MKRLEKLQNPDTAAFLRLFANSKSDGSEASCLGDDSNVVLGDVEYIDKANSVHLRPAREVLLRIMWDPLLIPTDFTVGYCDRFKIRYAEVKCDAPNDSIKGKERLFVMALPEHRIQYIKWRRRVVWHKSRRLDRVFGSGIPTLGVSTESRGARMGHKNAVPQYERIEDVIESYDNWLRSVNARERAARMRATQILGDEQFKAVKILSKQLLEGEITAAEYADETLSDEFFGSSGGDLRKIDQEEDGDEVAILLALVQTMPEEYEDVRSEAIEAIESRVSVLRATDGKSTSFSSKQQAP